MPPFESNLQNLSNIRVLIVEDNLVNQLLVKNLLRKFGIENFDCAENGKTTLSLISEINYDIILMDIQMPGMDGYEITTVIRKKMPEPIRSVPIIALTADASQKEKTKALEAGMNDYIVKPYNPEELYSTMLKHLGEVPNRVPENTNNKTANHSGTSSERKRKTGMELGFLKKITGGDLAITIQLIELFLKDVSYAIDKLEDLIPQERWKEVHAVAHKVKSSISIFELTELKKTILLVEEYSREETQVDSVAGLFLEFKSGCAEAIINLEEELKKLKQTTA